MNNEGEVFEIYPNTQEVLNLYKMGRKTLQDAIRDKRPAKGWYWKYTDKIENDTMETSSVTEATETTD